VGSALNGFHQPCSLGIQMHSGWGVLVVVSGDAGTVEIIRRRRIVITEAEMPGANQPYHYAAKLALAEAESYLTNCATASERLAVAAVGEVMQESNRRRYQIVGAAILWGAGRKLPPLAKILSAHPLIHTAEGEFFRNAVRRACERLKIAVATIRQRDLDEQAQAVFGSDARGLQRRIETVGSTIGPPWTKDHKTATLAALINLAKAGRTG
jgi:hypothetical protein